MVKRYPHSDRDNNPAENTIYTASGNQDAYQNPEDTFAPDSYSLEEEDDGFAADNLNCSLNGNHNASTFNDADQRDESRITSENDGISDNDEDESEADSKNNTGKPAPLKLLFEMMLNPVEGWKKIRRAKYSTEETARRCFYPISGIAAASCFADLFYTATAEVPHCVITAISIFAAFFFGNFLVLVAQKAFYPKSHKNDPESEFGKEFVMYNLSTLAIFWTLCKLLPMIAPVLAFLPLWTIYLAIRGCRFFRFPEEKANLTITLNCILLLGAPTAIYWLFSVVL